MAVRVTADEVKEIMDGVTSSDPTIEIFITAASAVIDNVFTGDTVIGTTLLKELERWLTAHMLASTLFRMSVQEKLGEAEVKYMGKWGENLASTPYGQMLKVLDTTGKISQLGKSSATMYAITSFDD